LKQQDYLRTIRPRGVIAARNLPSEFGNIRMMLPNSHNGRADEA
jgi:hypothetical protein